MKSVAVFNRKGGTGKTLTTILLSSYMAGAGRRVLAVDLDPDRSLTKHFLGTYEPLDVPENALTVFEILSGQDVSRSPIAKISSEIDLILGDERLGTIQSNAVVMALSRFLENRDGDYDFAAVDCAPRWSTIEQAAIVAAKGGVVAPLLLSMDEIERTRKVVDDALRYGAEKCAVLINQWKGDRQDHRYLELAEEEFGGLLLNARLPYNKILTRNYTDTSERINTHARAKKEFADSVRALVSEFVESDVLAEVF